MNQMATWRSGVGCALDFLLRQQVAGVISRCNPSRRRLSDTLYPNIELVHCVFFGVNGGATGPEVLAIFLGCRRFFQHCQLQRRVLGVTLALHLAWSARVSIY